jgi:hypothetical protein
MSIMGPMQVRERIATVLVIVGMVALGVSRFTPPSWFPWDVLVALVPFVSGFLVFLFARRSKSANAQAQ